MNPLAAAAKDAVLEAARQSTDEMSAGLRKHAREAGWPAKVARTLAVEHTETGFQWTGADEATDWEYGTAGRPPAPAIRRFSNRSDAEAVLVRNIEQALRDRGLM